VGGNLLDHLGLEPVPAGLQQFEDRSMAGQRRAIGRGGDRMCGVEER
jgi:hypothetical protein